MKKLWIALLTATLFITVDAAAKEKKTEKVYFTCEMDCHECEQKIGDELRFTKGVKDMKVDFGTGTVFVEFRSDKTEKAKIVEAIKGDEYNPKEISEEEYTKRTAKTE